MLTQLVCSKIDQKSKILNRSSLKRRFYEIFKMSSNHDCTGFYLVYHSAPSDDLLWRRTLSGKRKIIRKLKHIRIQNFSPLSVVGRKIGTNYFIVKIFLLANHLKYFWWEYSKLKSCRYDTTLDLLKACFENLSLGERNDAS